MQLEDLPPKYQKQIREKIKKSKYGAVKTKLDGIEFDSKGEAEHYASLKLLERAGIIQGLKLQPKFLLQDGFIYHGHKLRKIEYVADFQYQYEGHTVVEDFKGMKTDVYKLKRKLFLKKYGDKVEFKEITNGKDSKSR